MNFCRFLLPKNSPLSSLTLTIKPCYIGGMTEWNKSKIDQEQLRIEIRKMSSQSKLYKLLRDELSTLGFWRQRARWTPKGFVMKNAKNL